MKTAITGTFPFSASAKTVDLSSVASFDIRKLFAIINLTKSAVIYGSGMTGLGYTSVVSGVVTLQATTSGMADTDKLMVIYEETDEAIAILGSIEALLTNQPDIATSLFTDDSGAFYVRRDVIDSYTGGVTVTFTDSAGDPATPGAGLRPVASTEKTAMQTLYEAITAGTGYSIGDVVARVIIVDESVVPVTMTALWINATTGAVLASPPTPANIQLVNKVVQVASSALPAGAATETTLSAAKTVLDNILTELNLKLEAGQAVALDSATLASLENITVNNTDFPDAAVLAKLEAVRALLAGTLDVNVGLTDAQLRATPVPMSLAAVPLPTGAATSALQTTGNSSLSSIDTKVSGLTVSQGSTTSGQTGQLVQGAVGAANPTYTAGQTSPISLDTMGNLRVAMDADLAVTGQSAQTATVSNILTVVAGAAATDLLGYQSVTVQVVSTATGGTYIFEGSNDGTNFQTIPVFSQLVLTGTPITGAITATASQLIYTLPVTCRYLRLRIVTTITGGSIQAFSRFSQAAWVPAIVQIAQGTAANLNAAIPALLAGTNAVGDVGMQYRANATGAASIKHIVSAATTNATSTKASAGRLLGWSLANTTASWRYVKLHNTSGAPTAGSGVVMTIGIPPAGQVSQSHPGGIGFATGIGYTIVTGSADADTTAVAVGDVVGSLHYA